MISRLPVNDLDNFNRVFIISSMRVYLEIVVSQSATFVIKRLKRVPISFLASKAMVESWSNSFLHTSLTFSEALNSNFRAADLGGTINV